MRPGPEIGTRPFPFNRGRPRGGARRAGCRSRARCGSRRRAPCKATRRRRAGGSAWIRSRQRKKASITARSHCVPAPSVEDALDLLGGHRRAVGPRGAHRVVAVGHGEDPGEERDRLALEPLGVALAVELLVVVEHAGQEVGDRLQAGEDAVADLDVLVDVLELLGGERPALAQDGVADADLADVVEQAGEVDVAQLVLLAGPARGRARRRPGRPARCGRRCTSPWRRSPR